MHGCVRIIALRIGRDECMRLADGAVIGEEKLSVAVMSFVAENVALVKGEKPPVIIRYPSSALYAVLATFHSYIWKTLNTKEYQDPVPRRCIVT